MNEFIQVAGCAWKHGREAGHCREVGSQMGQMKFGVLLQSLVTNAVAARKV